VITCCLCAVRSVLGLNRHPWHRCIIGQKTETLPQKQRSDRQRACTMRDYIVTYGKLSDERGKLKPSGLLWFEQAKPVAWRLLLSM
jgi:hypothetical protein